jgi:hypothetical protein
MAGQTKRAGERGERIRIVIHNQQAAHEISPAAGKSILNVAPRPGALDTEIFP